MGGIGIDATFKVHALIVSSLSSYMKWSITIGHYTSAISNGVQCMNEVQIDFLDMGIKLQIRSIIIGAIFWPPQHSELVFVPFLSDLSKHLIPQRAHWLSLYEKSVHFFLFDNNRLLQVVLLNFSLWFDPYFLA